MFEQAASFDQPLHDWVVSSVTSADEMFFGGAAFEQDISGWDFSSLQTCSDFGHPGCNPTKLVELGCVDTCCPTQVTLSRIIQYQYVYIYIYINIY